MAESIGGSLDEVEYWIFNASDCEPMFACGVAG